MQLPSQGLDGRASASRKPAQLTQTTSSINPMLQPANLPPEGGQTLIDANMPCFRSNLST